MPMNRKIAICTVYGTDCKILLDMGTSKSFMSETFYLSCLSLHSLPRFASRKNEYFRR